MTMHITGRRCGKTFRMVNLADFARGFDFDAPIPTHHKELIMRLSPATKRRHAMKDLRQELSILTAQLAVERQKVKDLSALAEKQLAAYAQLSTEKASLQSEMAAIRKLAEGRATEIVDRDEHIRRLGLTNAELRGYIARTLEDDAVREAETAVVDQQDSVTETRFKPREKPRRAGPVALQMIHGGMDMAAGECSNSGSVGSRNATWRDVRNWMDRP